MSAMERLLSICRLTKYPHTHGLTKPLVDVCNVCRGTAHMWSCENPDELDDPFGGIEPYMTDKPCINRKCERGLVASEGTLQSGPRGWTLTLRYETEKDE